MKKNRPKKYDTNVLVLYFFHNRKIPERVYRKMNEPIYQTSHNISGGS
ncbi:MAG: hypothetical protein ACJAZ9_000242 [Neolewinella sp.]|jgi:hypothetical protein